MADVELTTDGARLSLIEEPGEAQERLVSALRNGDEAAFIALVKCHHAMLVRMARLYLPDSADDVAHEVWLDLLRRVDCLDASRSVRVTLLTILFDQVRRRAPLREIPVPAAAHWDPAANPALPSVDPSSFRSSDPWIGHWAVPVVEWGQVPVERLRLDEARVRIEQAIAMLPPAQREVVALRDVEGWTSAEVSEALGIKATHQRSLLHQARSRIRTCLDAALQQP
jgi:RNA polymerase sigma-70 factor (ECF subfamily)